MLGFSRLSCSRNAPSLLISNGTSGITARLNVGEIGGEEGGLAAVTAEKLDDGNAFMRARWRTQRSDEIDAACDGGAEADAVICTENIIVHRLGDGHHREALLVEAPGVTERVVTSDSDQSVNM